MKRAALAASMLSAFNVFAQLPQLPPPDSVSLDALGLMSTYPPSPA
jgi:hypothetical protein